MSKADHPTHYHLYKVIWPDGTEDRMETKDGLVCFAAGRCSPYIFDIIDTAIPCLRELGAVVEDAN